MAYFNVNNKRQEDGSYELSYGKGGNKLFARMLKDSDGWQVEGDAPRYNTMKECKAAWREWAEENYGAGASKSKAETAPPKTSAPPPGPPSLKGPPKLTPKPSPPPVQHTDKSLPALLAEVDEWYGRYENRIKDIALTLAEDSSPGFNPFDNLIPAIREYLNSNPEDSNDEQQQDPEKQPPALAKLGPPRLKAPDPRTKPGSVAAAIAQPGDLDDEIPPFC